MNERKLQREVGNWVDGDRFWNRDQEIRSLMEHLDEGANLLLVAQRRTGKTSLMRETARRIEGRYTCLHVDLEKCHSAGEAITEISVATKPKLKLWDRTKHVFRNIFGGAASRVDELSISEVTIKLRDGLAADWQVKGDELLAALAEIEPPVVLFIDELPILVNRLLKGDEYRMTPERVRAADAFLSWLRSLTLRHRGELRFVVTGSIGLEPILRQAGLSATANTFTPFELGPWSAETARGCLEALGRQYGVEFADGALARITERLGACVPHHVQLFFSHLYEDGKRRRLLSCAVEDVDRVYEKSMLSSRGHAELSHFEERLRMVLGAELMPLALDLLTEAAVSERLDAAATDVLWRDFRPEDGDGAPTLREILGILEHDGYLRKEGERYVFNSRLLQDWWKACFSFGYSPARERRS